jgi:hypothetical protein
MTWSYLTAFSFATGAALIAHQSVAVAIGTGLVTGASAAVFLFVRSPLTRNLVVAIPRDLALDAGTRDDIVTIKGQK